MNKTGFNSSEIVKVPVLRYCLAAIGLTFLVFGLGLTIGIVYLAFSILTQPEQLSTLFSYINTHEDIFFKWVTKGQVDEIVFSRIVMIVFYAMAGSIILNAIISFISMCVSSGKGILSISRNFDN